MRFFDVPFTVDMLRYFAGWPTKLTGDTIPISYPASFGGAFHSYTLRQPVGVVGAITPWNLPLLMVVKKLAPALAAGCTIVIKPAEQTPLSMALLARLALEAGIPEGVVNFVTGFGEEAGAALVAHPGVDKISFTGSSETGKLIARQATDTLKRVSLELGGKSPNIVFADADPAAAIQGACDAIFACQGESCIAGSRLYVQEPLFDEIVAGVTERARSLQARARGSTPAPRWGRSFPPSSSSVSRLHRHRPRRGRRDRHRRRALGRRGLVHRADRAGQRHRRDARHARGDLRPGADRAPVQGRGRRCSRPPTTAASAWPPRSGPPTSPAPTGWPRRSSPGRCGSTATRRATRRCRSAATRSPAGAVRPASETLDEYTELKTVVVSLGAAT